MKKIQCNRGRPRLRRRVRFIPQASFFKPRGRSMRNLEIVELSREEVEALRLKYVQGYNQQECADLMKTSQSTFQRLLRKANEKISQAIVLAKAIKIEEKMY